MPAIRPVALLLAAYPRLANRYTLTLAAADWHATYEDLLRCVDAAATADVVVWGAGLPARSWQTIHDALAAGDVSALCAATPE
jgi:hypothetical protein